ncbi:hypothetical protein K474DRAFT_1709408 [Panus rudis PR-1116 ss-1]|nr:hypothetical protein K474DRAFT_1709408 [Panus rudis PR-1116 ss-1]
MSSSTTPVDTASAPDSPRHQPHVYHPPAGPSSAPGPSPAYGTSYAANPMHHMPGTSTQVPGPSYHYYAPGYAVPGPSFSPSSASQNFASHYHPPPPVPPSSHYHAYTYTLPPLPANHSTAPSANHTPPAALSASPTFEDATGRVLNSPPKKSKSKKRAAPKDSNLPPGCAHKRKRRRAPPTEPSHADPFTAGPIHGTGPATEPVSQTNPTSFGSFVHGQRRSSGKLTASSL